jgi:hypothetical protein
LASALIDGERQSAFDLVGFRDCRVCRWPTASALSIEDLPPSIAFDIHLQDRGVVHEAIDGRERHGLITEHL